MSPHTDAGALLKLAERIENTPIGPFSILLGMNDELHFKEVMAARASIATALRQAANDGYRAAWLELIDACNKLKEENFNLRQAASQGSAGGERSEVQSTPVSYRWRQPGNKHWIYDPTPAWIEDHKHEIELEALYLRAAQAQTGCGIVEALQIAAGRIAGMGTAAARINLFGRLSEAYGAAEVEVKQLAKQIQSGEDIEDRNGIKHQFAKTSPALNWKLDRPECPRCKGQGRVGIMACNDCGATGVSVPSASRATPETRQEKNEREMAEGTRCNGLCKDGGQCNC